MEIASLVYLGTGIAVSEGQSDDCVWGLKTPEHLPENPNKITEAHVIHI